MLLPTWGQPTVGPYIFGDQIMPIAVEGIPITAGSHDPKSGGQCGMEYLNWKYRKEWSDSRPDCVCPTLHSLIIKASDDPRTTEDERKPGGLLMQCCDAAWETFDPETNSKRMFRSVDWSIRTVVPLALGSANLHAEAQKLLDHPPVTDIESAWSASAAAAAAAAAWSASASADVPRVIDRLAELTEVQAPVEGI